MLAQDRRRYRSARSQRFIEPHGLQDVLRLTLVDVGICLDRCNGLGEILLGQLHLKKRLLAIRSLKRSLRTRLCCLRTVNVCSGVGFNGCVRLFLQFHF